MSRTSKILWAVVVTIHLIGSSFILILSRGASRYDHVHLFAAAVFVVPLVTFLLRWPTLRDRFSVSGGSGGYWLLAYSLFVNYHNRPWFGQHDPRGCDGPCFNWYTFEFDPPYWLLTVILGFAVVCELLLYVAGSVVRRWLNKPFGRSFS